MSSERSRRWQMRWGVLHFTTGHWKWPDHRLTRHGVPIGVRWHQHGWIFMPVYRLANWLFQ